jgi:hypothetical protein
LLASSYCIPLLQGRLRYTLRLKVERSNKLKFPFLRVQNKLLFGVFVLFLCCNGRKKKLLDVNRNEGQKCYIFICVLSVYNFLKSIIFYFMITITYII